MSDRFGINRNLTLHLGAVARTLDNLAILPLLLELTGGGS